MFETNNIGKIQLIRLLLRLQKALQRYMLPFMSVGILLIGISFILSYVFRRSYTLFVIIEFLGFWFWILGCFSVGDRWQVNSKSFLSVYCFYLGITVFPLLLLIIPFMGFVVVNSLGGAKVPAHESQSSTEAYSYDEMKYLYFIDDITNDLPP